VRACDPPAEWLAQWRVELKQKGDRRWIALVTNVTTLYSFVFPLKELGNGAKFEKLFRLRLGLALANAPSLASWKEAPIVFAEGNPRVAIGSMNDMRNHLAWRTEAVADSTKGDEDLINQTPYLSLPTSFPDKEFAQRVAEARNTAAP
jgi:hypothetical protein